MRITILTAGETLRTIALLRGGFEGWIRDAVRAPPACQAEWATHDLRTPAPLPGPRSADAFVITGSRSSVTERAPWMLRAEGLVRDIVSARVPLLGICFGHQLVAQALGGHVHENPHGREIGTVRVNRLADDLLFTGLPRAFDVNATHVDSVVRLPPGAEVLAHTDIDPACALRFGPQARGVQFHPEIDADVMRGYLRARAEVIRAEGGDPDALLARVHPGTRGRDILRNFAKSVTRAT